MHTTVYSIHAVHACTLRRSHFCFTNDLYHSPPMHLYTGEEGQHNYTYTYTHTIDIHNSILKTHLYSLNNNNYAYYYTYAGTHFTFRNKMRGYKYSQYMYAQRKTQTFLYARYTTVNTSFKNELSIILYT